MARIAGVDLPRDKRVEIGLTYIYGIGRVSSNRILKDAGVNPDTRCRDLTDEEVKKISAVIDETQTVEGDLRKSDATEESVTEKDSRFVDRRQRQTQEQEKVRREQWQTRRSKMITFPALGISTENKKVG